MRPIIIFVTLTLTSLIYVSGQPAPPGGRAQKARGKVMVKRLPVKVEGVTLKDGQVKLKPGYKFVKRTDGTVAVARISGSVGLGNTISGRGVAYVMVLRSCLLKAIVTLFSVPKSAAAT